MEKLGIDVGGVGRRCRDVEKIKREVGGRTKIGRKEMELEEGRLMIAMAEEERYQETVV